MSTPVNVDFATTGSAKVEQAWERYAKGAENFIRTLGNIAPESLKADQAQRQLGATSEKWLKQLQSPLDAHLRRMSELQALRQANTLTEQKYADGIAISVKMMKEEEAAADKLGMAAKRVLAEQVTAQDVFNNKLEELNTLRGANKLTEQQYATAVDKAQKTLEAQDGTLHRIQQETARVAAAQAALAKEGDKLRASLVTPQSEYADALARANQLLNAEEISEAQYALAVDKARLALEAQDGTLKKVQADTAKVTAAQAELASQGAKLRASLVTPQSEYAEALGRANKLLHEGEISEADYAMAVDLAKKNLDAQDQSLQKNLADATRIKALAVTPQQEYARAIKNADDLLKRKLITQKQYDAELKNQNDLLRKAEAGQNGFGNSVLSTAGQFASQLTGITGILGTATTVVSTLKAEYDDMLDRQKTAADRQLDTAGEQRAAIFALGDDPEITADDLTARAEATAPKIGKTVKEVYDAYGNALSARGELLAAQALDSADLAMATSPQRGATDIAGSLVGMKRKFGGKDEQLMGLNIAGQQVSRVKDQASYAANVVPTIIGLGGYGNSAREATALPTAMSVAMEDLMGRQSATASEKIAAQLKLANEKYKTGLTTTAQQIEFLWTDAGDKMRKDLLGDGKGKKGSMDIESGALIATHELLSKGSNKTKDAYKSALETIPELAEAGAYYEKSMQRVNSQKLQQQSAADRTLKAGADKLAIKDEAGARTSIAREGLENSLRAAGAGWTERFIQARMFNVGNGTANDTAFALSNKAEALRNPTVGSWNPFASRTPRAPTPEELSRAESLQQTADQLRGIKRDANGRIIESGNRRDAGPPNLQDIGTAVTQDLAGNHGNTSSARPISADGAALLTSALVANTAATIANTQKPPVKVAKPVNQPTKQPASVALAAPGGR
ncbi:MAG: hypothetical protein V4719_26610 [Planctomycetota bacterium]